MSADATGFAAPVRFGLESHGPRDDTRRYLPSPCMAFCSNVWMGVERVCGELIASEQPVGRGEAHTHHHALLSPSVSAVLDRFVLKLRELLERQRALAEVDDRPASLPVPETGATDEEAESGLYKMQSAFGAAWAGQGRTP